MKPVQFNLHSFDDIPSLQSAYVMRLRLECSVLRRIQSSLEFISRALLLTPWKIYYRGQKIYTKISVIFKINYLENF